MATLTTCTTRGCRRLVSLNTRRCSLHAAVRSHETATHRTVRYGYSTAHWQRLRSERRALAGGSCELHLDEHCTSRATHTHLDPALHGNHRAARLEDTRACCAHCSGAIDGIRAHQ